MNKKRKIFFWLGLPPFLNDTECARDCDIVIYVLGTNFATDLAAPRNVAIFKSSQNRAEKKELCLKIHNLWWYKTKMLFFCKIK